MTTRSVTLGSFFPSGRLLKAKGKRAAVGCVHLVCVSVAAGSLTIASAQTNEGQPAAVVNGEALYETDFLPEIEDQLYKVRRQEYEIKRTALESEISRRLVRAEAQARGLTEEEWIRQEVDSKIAEPTEDEIERAFISRMFRGGGAPPGRAEIADELMQERLQLAREEFFWKLREGSGVRVFLLPPRLDVDYDPDRVQGNPNAPIVLVEFSDFHCPFCQQAYATVKALLEKYDGTIKVGYRDLPLQEVPSAIADSADAARCAGEQGKFWEYHDLLFENSDDFGEVAFKAFADLLNLERNRFATCLESGKFKASIQADAQEGLRLGATGTPYFFINGIPLSGALPQAEFEDIIEQELAAIEQAR